MNLGRCEKRESEYTKRPLNDVERKFAVEHMHCLYGYMRGKKLDCEEWYDILIIPYLNAVKKYVTERPDLQIYAFSTILKNVLATAYHHHFRALNTQARKPVGGVVSLDYELETDNLFEERNIDEWWIDKRSNVERQVISKEMYEFFRSEIERTIFKGEETLKILDMIMFGYTEREIIREMKKTETFDYWNKNTFEQELDRIRKVFYNVYKF